MDHDFGTVDQRGLKAALAARAQVDRTTVWVLLRTAVARELGLEGECVIAARSDVAAASTGSVKLSIRMKAEEVRRMDEHAAQACHEPGFAHTGRLEASPGVPVPQWALGRDEMFTALKAWVEQGTAPDARGSAAITTGDVPHRLLCIVTS